MRGHIRRRGSSWQAIVLITEPGTGKQRQISGTRSTKRDAEDLLLRLLAQAGRSDQVGSKATVGKLLTAWQELNASAWSPASARQTEAVVRRYLMPRIGDVLVRKLRTADLDGMYAELRASGGVDGKPLSPATVRKIHTALRSALAQAVRWEWTSDNPAARATLPSGERREIRAPRPSNVVAIIDEAMATDVDFGTWLHLAAATGARRGELCALRWSDLDLDAGTLTIQRALALGKVVVEKPTKTGNRRRMSLDAATLEVLRQHRRRAREDTLAAGGHLADDAYIFSLDVGGFTPWRPDLPTHRFVRLRKTLGLDHIRLHDLRHFHATTLLGAGIDLATVAGRLGHAGGGRTTLAVYAHALETADRRSADLVAEVLRDAR